LKLIEEMIGPSMNRTIHPSVDIYCLYGEGVSTTYHFYFDQGIFDSPYRKVDPMDGDGNQDIIDNTFCKVWDDQKVDQSTIQTYFKFASQGFQGVTHMHMISDTNVLNYLHSILVTDDSDRDDDVAALDDKDRP